MALIALTAGLWLVALLLYRHDQNLRANHRQFGTDLFDYSKRRAVCRTAGIITLIVLGTTLLAFEFAPPTSPTMGWLYLAALFVQLSILLVVGAMDLWETKKTAAPADLNRQAEQDHHHR